MRRLPDGVASAEAEPLRQRAVLSHLLSENTLGAERLLGRLLKWIRTSIRTRNNNYHYLVVDYDNYREPTR